MNQDRLKALLHETPVPAADEAERRALRIAAAAFDQRQPAPRPVLPRLAVALAAMTLFAALLLTPAGAAVRDWIDDVFTVGVRDAEPALTEVPGGGRLLVGSTEGPWVVQPDGSRRLLGSYEEATWSPRGLYVAAASGHALNAVEPDGTVRWSLSAAGPLADPRWSPSGFRIAYRAGQTLRVVAGDGTGDALLAQRTASLPPVWSPQGPHLLAYLDGRGGLRVVNADSRQTISSTKAPAATTSLDWAADGSQLLTATRRSLLLREARVGKLTDELTFGPARNIPLPVGTIVRDASYSPSGETIAALLGLPGRGARPPHSELVLIDPADGSLQVLFTAPGVLPDLAWSPDGRRLLIPWPDADQWLFIPASGEGRVRAIGGISTEFAPGTRDAAFPQIEGWCC